MNESGEIFHVLKNLWEDVIAYVMSLCSSEVSAEHSIIYVTVECWTVWKWRFLIHEDVCKLYRIIKI